jgi:hypothetical protein
MSKLIGAEIRIGYEGQQLHEVKLVPIEVEFRPAQTVVGTVFYNNPPAVAEITFHTTDGDVTMRVQLPSRSQESPEMAAIRRQLEKGA